MRRVTLFPCDVIISHRNVDHQRRQVDTLTWAGMYFIMQQNALWIVRRQQVVLNGIGALNHTYSIEYSL